MRKEDNKEALLEFLESDEYKEIVASTDFQVKLAYTLQEDSKRPIDKYEYYLSTWGGYWNQSNDKGHVSGDHWFDTEEERSKYVEQLLRDAKAEKRWDAMVAYVTRDGYNTHLETICHRVVRYKGKEIYSHLNMGYAYPYDTAEYHMEYKWTPGFNDEAAIDDADDLEELAQVEIIQEWITVS